MAVHTFNPEGVPVPPPTYKQVATTEITRNGTLITLAGQTGIDPTTGKVSPHFVEQARTAYISVLNCLKAAGATPKDIVHVRHYIVHDSRDAKLNALDIVDRGYGEHWIEFMNTYGEGHLPPDTVLGVASLAKKELLYEIECWAFVPA